MKSCILFAFFATAFAAASIPERCTLPAHPGFCRMPWLRWWYNVETGQCEEFYYGGCSGNANRFETKELCEETCSQHQSHDRQRRRVSTNSLVHFTGPICERGRHRGPCQHFIPRFYFDAEKKSCRKFLFGGCMSNLNNFRTLEACMEACGPRERPSRKPHMK